MSDILNINSEFRVGKFYRMLSPYDVMLYNSREECGRITHTQVEGGFYVGTGWQYKGIRHRVTRNCFIITMIKRPQHFFKFQNTMHHFIIPNSSQRMQLDNEIQPMAINETLPYLHKLVNGDYHRFKGSNIKNITGLKYPLCSEPIPSLNPQNFGSTDLLIGSIKSGKVMCTMQALNLKESHSVPTINIFEIIDKNVICYTSSKLSRQNISEIESCFKWSVVKTKTILDQHVFNITDGKGEITLPWT